jgi:GH24 family phage-related lysozyme (muramidase)/uncharacterized protein YycO
MAYTIGTNIEDGVDLNSARSAVENYLKMDNLTTKSSSGEIEKAEVVNNSVTASKSIIDIYGIRQEIVIQSNKQDPKVTALRKLNDNCIPKEELIVEVIGDTMYRVGYGVHVILPFLRNYNDCFMYIKEMSNEWKNNGVFISTLTLTPSRVMDEQEWSDMDESDSISTSGGSATAKKIVALLTQQIGKPYEWSKSGPNSFDCSGLLYYCYNQFSNELIDSKPIGRTTYDQIKDGKEVSTDKSSWVAGDLLFWKGDGSFAAPAHVSAYIGNDKMIEAPKTGVPVRLVDVTRKDLYAVRRVIPEDTTSNTETASKNTASEKLIEFIKSKESFFSTPYYDSGGVLTIGYGTTKDANPSAFSSGSCTEEQATQWLKQEVNKCATEIQNLLDKKNIALMQCQFDALIDFAYNCGSGALEKSGLINFVYGESSKSASEAFMVYTRDEKGQVQQGLITRRKQEADMWLYGKYEMGY